MTKLCARINKSAHLLSSVEKPNMKQAKAYRAAILHSLGDPSQLGINNSYEYLPDGLLVVEKGHICDIGPATEVLARWTEIGRASCRERV